MHDLEEIQTKEFLNETKIEHTTFGKEAKTKIYKSTKKIINQRRSRFYISSTKKVLLISVQPIFLSHENIGYSSKKGIYANFRK